jgi:hypothetical protein
MFNISCFSVFILFYTSSFYYIYSFSFFYKTLFLVLNILISSVNACSLHLKSVFVFSYSFFISTNSTTLSILSSTYCSVLGENILHLDADTALDLQLKINFEFLFYLLNTVVGSVSFISKLFSISNSLSVYISIFYLDLVLNIYCFFGVLYYDNDLTLIDNLTLFVFKLFSFKQF